MNKIVEQIIKKELFKRGGVMASREAVETAYRALEARMKPLGLDITAIKSEADYNRALGFVKSLEDQIFAKKFGDTLNKKDADIISIIDKKKLDPNKPIMGGTQDEKEMLKKSIDKNVAEASKRGDFKGIFNQVLRDPDIAEEFSRLKAAEKLQRERDLTKKLIPDRDIIPYQSVEIQSMTPAEKQKYLITDDKQTAELLKRGYTFDDIIYAQDNYGLSAKEIVQEALGATKDDPFPFATGGRAGFKVGSPSKRAFLKAAGGLAALLTAIKSGLIGTPKKEVAKQVIKETAKDVGSAPPTYFFDLANKIKLLGKESKIKPKERTNEYNYTGKNGDQYTLTEDIGTGEMQITKDKIGVGSADEKTFDTIEDRTVMEYKPGKSMADESTQGTPADEYDEFRVDFDVDGTPADADEISSIIKKEIIEEASEIPQQKIKRAGGGVAYMLGE